MEHAAAQPDLQRLPVNRQHDLGGKQWQGSDLPEDRGIVQRASLGADRRVEPWRIAVLELNRDAQPRARFADVEAVAAGNIEEWRDVKAFLFLLHLAIRKLGAAGCEPVAVLLAKRIADLGDHRAPPTTRAPATPADRNHSGEGTR